MRNDMEQQIEIQNRIQSMMEIPSLESVVKFYARFDFSQDSKKTPKYTMSLQAGDSYSQTILSCLLSEAEKL
jgi:hypothetical protein